MPRRSRLFLEDAVYHGYNRFARDAGRERVGQRGAMGFIETVRKGVATVPERPEHLKARRPIFPRPPLGPAQNERGVGKRRGQGTRLGLLVMTVLVLAATGVSGQATPAPSPTAPPLRPPEVSPTFQGGLGFTSLPYLLDRDLWPKWAGPGTRLRSGPADLGLGKPLEVIVVFNAWHLPAAEGAEDLRLIDLRKHLLRPTLALSSQWPEYGLPGFIVLIRKQDREWALVARLSKHYLVEDRFGIALCPVASD